VARIYCLETPHSRLRESEADELGLLLMSKACFNPNAAVLFWQGMQEVDQGTPEFLSTHPTSATRIEHLKKLMFKAEQAFRDAGCGQVLLFHIDS
jgi:predicted Zn-dependent protease